VSGLADLCLMPTVRNRVIYHKLGTMKRLLIVDDDYECLTALSNRLRFQFRTVSLVVDIADSASEGIILAHMHRYDAVIVDRLMPGIGGAVFVKQLRQIQPAVPVIMMSGGTPDDHMPDDHMNELALVALLPKPIEFYELCEVLRSLLVGSESAGSRNTSDQRTEMRTHARAQPR
jgi:DNA-binding response OmpR family regulator